MYVKGHYVGNWCYLIVHICVGGVPKYPLLLSQHPPARCNCYIAFYQLLTVLAISFLAYSHIIFYYNGNSENILFYCNIINNVCVSSMECRCNLRFSELASREYTKINILFIFGKNRPSHQ